MGRRTVKVGARSWVFDGREVEPRWRFGVGQTQAEEAAEIEAAQRAGRTEAYMAGQLHSRLIEAETERRRRGWAA